MNKSIFKVFILNCIIISLLAYVLGLTDSAFESVYPSNNIISYLINSVKYFIFWVLPFWWIIIVCGSAVLTLLYLLIKKNI